MYLDICHSKKGWPIWIIFGTKYFWHNLPLNDRLFFHLTQCLLLHYLGKTKPTKMSRMFFSGHGVYAYGPTRLELSGFKHRDTLICYIWSQSHKCLQTHASVLTESTTTQIITVYYITTYIAECTWLVSIDCESTVMCIHPWKSAVHYDRPKQRTDMLATGRLEHQLTSHANLNKRGTISDLLCPNCTLLQNTQHK